MSSTNCKACGAILPEGAIICPACGKPANDTASTTAPVADIPATPVMPQAPAATAPTAAAAQQVPPPMANGAAPPPAYGTSALGQPEAYAPYGQPMAPGSAPYGQPGMPGQAPLPVAKKFSALAIASLVVSLIGLIIFGFICGGIAIVLGLIALITFKSATQKGRGFAIAGLLIGIFDIVALYFLF